MPRVSDERLAAFTKKWILYSDPHKRCHDGCANDAADLAADLRDARAEVARLSALLDEALGIGPGSNDGPWTNCTDCGRRMVWQYPVNVLADEPGCPAWTCPNCVVRRARSAEDRVKELTALLAAVRPTVRAAVAHRKAWGEHGAHVMGPVVPNFLERAEELQDAEHAAEAALVAAVDALSAEAREWAKEGDDA